MTLRYGDRKRGNTNRKSRVDKLAPSAASYILSTGQITDAIAFQVELTFLQSIYLSENPTCLWNILKNCEQLFVQPSKSIPFILTLGLYYLIIFIASGLSLLVMMIFLIGGVQLKKHLQNLSRRQNIALKPVKK